MQVGPGNHSMNDKGVRHYKSWNDYYHKESKIDKRGIKRVWKKYHKEQGMNLEWRDDKEKA